MRRVALVLHTHLPYVRRNGTWPSGEDFFHQAATESYLPLIGVLERLAESGLRSFATVGVTPVLAEQMRDPHMRDELVWYLGSWELRALRQVANYRGYAAAEIKDLAAYYARFARTQLARLESHGGDMTTALGALARAGAVELIGGPATHPVLPLADPAFASLQLAAGLASHERIFGARPRGVWLPECAAAPGLEAVLDDAGVGHVVVEHPGVAGPYHAGESGVVAVPLDREAIRLVWCPDGGYPAGDWYRDFHHYDVVAGFKNWRVTSRDIGWLGKKVWDPDRAAAEARGDAAAFVAALERRLDATGRTSLVACFDTELLGHWWFEGPAWLEETVRLLSAHPTIRPATLAEVTAEARARRALPESTWGDGNDLRSWVAPETEDLWKRIRDAETETLALLPRAEGAARDQLLRELMLMQSSDWSYLIVKEQNAGYARQRFDTHHDRWSWLADAIRHGRDTSRLVADLAPIDSVPERPVVALPGAPKP